MVDNDPKISDKNALVLQKKRNSGNDACFVNRIKSSKVGKNIMKNKSPNKLKHLFANYLIDDLKRKHMAQSLSNPVNKKK